MVKSWFLYECIILRFVISNFYLVWGFLPTFLEKVGKNRYFCNCAGVALGTTAFATAQKVQK